MTELVPKILFKGQEYLLIGSLKQGGSIATMDQYEQGSCSYAHLFPDGSVKRFSEQIGSREDIEVIGTEECSPDPDAFFNVMFGKGWPTGMKRC